MCCKSFETVERTVESRQQLELTELSRKLSKEVVTESQSVQTPTQTDRCRYDADSIAAQVEGLQTVKAFEGQLADAAVNQDEAAQMTQRHYTRQTPHASIQHLYSTHTSHTHIHKRTFEVEWPRLWNNMPTHFS